MKKRYNPLRAKLDLTQQELAHFLQLPLSTVAMCERGKRTWPTKGLLRLARLELAWVAAENLPVGETSLVPELVEAIGKLKNRMKECLEKAGLLQRMLDSMKTLSLLLKTKEKTLQLLSEPGTSSIHQGWVEIQQYYIGEPLAENSLAKQIMIEHQVQTLQAEAASAAATIERLEQQMEEELADAAGEKHQQRRDAAGNKFRVDSGQRCEERLDAAGGKSRKHSGQRHQPLQKQDTVVSSAPKQFVEPTGFDPGSEAAGEKHLQRCQPTGLDLCLKRNYDRTRYHRTTSTATAPRRRLLQRNLSRRLFHQQPRQQTTEHQHRDLLPAAGFGQIAFSPHQIGRVLVFPRRTGLGGPHHTRWTVGDDHTRQRSEGRRNLAGGDSRRDLVCRQGEK
jgi:DNA-binding XRE family transcriptional regulator